MPDAKGHMHDFTHMKCPEQTNPKRLKADWWFQGLERAGRSTERSMGPGFNFGGMEIFWNRTEVVAAQHCELNATELHTLNG